MVVVNIEQKIARNICKVIVYKEEDSIKYKQSWKKIADPELALLDRIFSKVEVYPEHNLSQLKF